MTEELHNNKLPGTAESKTFANNVSSPQIPGKYRVMRRNGKVTSYDLSKIIVAMTKAFLSVEGSSAAASTRIHNEVELLANKVDTAIKRRFPEGGVVHIEDIQDQVELAIMRAGYQDVARAYVLYREERNQARSQNKVASIEDMPIQKSIIREDGTAETLDSNNKDTFLDRIPLNKYGTPMDVASLTSFLCSDKVNYITGQNINVDGGITI